MRSFEDKVTLAIANNRSILRLTAGRKLFKIEKPAINSGFLLSTPERTRTPNLLVRSQTLYPIELQAHIYSMNRILKVFLFLNLILDIGKKSIYYLINRAFFVSIYEGV